MAKIKTVKGAKVWRRGCFLLGAITLFGSGMLAIIHYNPAIPAFVGVTSLIFFSKMMYWDLVLRLDKSLK